jgi:hypothetical protein
MPVSSRMASPWSSDYGIPPMECGLSTLNHLAPLPHSQHSTQHTSTTQTALMNKKGKCNSSIFCIEPISAHRYPPGLRPSKRISLPHGPASPLMPSANTFQNPLPPPKGIQKPPQKNSVPRLNSPPHLSTRHIHCHDNATLHSGATRPNPLSVCQGRCDNGTDLFRSNRTISGHIQQRKQIHHGRI